VDIVDIEEHRKLTPSDSKNKPGPSKSSADQF
jgi:hypothetical protein